ncbi:hypothetical protein [Xenophilus sp. Marseille-Q4582]|uniref:hypothetical protein n=1 Tax=Xenophilus sp. Marseille-Q4582 TaxID=2866600 RepID=UPI001CE494DC|nr:hypothetical protein [Xenophilus sp. Marseille-Q4582]
MKVVVPVPIDDTTLLSTTVDFPSPTAAGDGVGAELWNAGATYAAGARVVRAETGRYYQSVAGGNTGNVPEQTTATDPPKWVDLGNANKWRMLRLDANRRTVSPSPLVVEIAPGARVDAIGIPFVEADQVQIEQYDSNDVLVKTWTLGLVGRNTRSWSDYFFGAFRPATNTYVDDVHLIAGSRLKFTFTRATGDVSVGPIVIGRSVEMGSTAMGAKVSGKSFSVIRENAFGDRTFVKRHSVPIVEQDTLVEGLDVDAITQALNDIDGSVALWVGIDRPDHWYFKSLMVLGFARSWDFSLDHYDKPHLNTKIEGL